MFNRKWVLGELLFLSLVWAGPPTWVIVNSPATDTFNGISAPNSEFAIAVGNNGTIVHFIDGDNGTVMTSGTNNDLFDVYASSANLAVATGEDVVLLWDGVNWSTLRAENEGTIFTGTWISPEEDVMLYGILDSSFSFVCPEIPDDPVPSFCRTFGRPMLTACGNSNDIKLITTDGDIYHVNNFLGDVNGTNPIHDEPVPLSLDGVWVPGDSCLPGPIALIEAFAIRNHIVGEFWHFDGTIWANMNVNIPADQVFTWIGGISSNHVTAVGFKPDGMGGNQGVVWNYDGSAWTEDTNLPVGTPGLTDIAANVSAPDFIFINGFESNITRMANGTTATTYEKAAAENGQVISLIMGLEEFTDIQIKKSRLTNGPFSNGSSITYQIDIENLGNATAIDFLIIDTFTNMDYVSDTCNFTFRPPPDDLFLDWDSYDRRVASLAPGEVLTCTMQLTINGLVSFELINQAYVTEVDDYNTSNNSSSSSNVFIEAPQ